MKITFELSILHLIPSITQPIFMTTWPVHRDLSHSIANRVTWSHNLVDQTSELSKSLCNYSLIQ